MPTGARSVQPRARRVVVAARREAVKPTTLSVEFRALQQFWKWALEEEEIERSPMERMKPPRDPRRAGPGGVDRRLPEAAPDGRGQRTTTQRRDTAILLLLLDTGHPPRRADRSRRRGRRPPRPPGLRHRQGRPHPGRPLRRQDGRGARPLPAAPTRPPSLPSVAELWLGQDGPMTTSGIAQIVAKRCAAAGLAAAAPAPVPTHVRPRVPRRRRPGGRPAAAGRLEVAPDARPLRRVHSRGAGARALHEPRRPAVSPLEDTAKRLAAQVAQERAELDDFVADAAAKGIWIRSSDCAMSRALTSACRSRPRASYRVQRWRTPSRFPSRLPEPIPVAARPPSKLPGRVVSPVRS